MSVDAFIYDSGQWVLFCVFFGLMLAAAQAGAWLGLVEFKHGRSERHPLLNTASSAALTLLGLLLGFTFSMAVSRYDARREMVLQESNDIGTAYLRTQLLPKPQSETSAALLRRYVDNRLAIYTTLDQAARAAEIQKGGELQDRLWAESMAAANGNPASFYTTLYVQALNSVIDSHSSRLDAGRNHVPNSAILLLVFSAVLCMAMLGFLGGLSGARSLLTSITLSLLFAMVVAVIVDLDRPRRGLIRVSQSPMLELQKSLNSKPASSTGVQAP